MDNIDFSVEDFTDEQLVCNIDIEKKDLTSLPLKEEEYEKD